MQHRPRIHSTAGFSLVELSIVLVILGLLVGGILAGQSLIRAAELRSVTTENSRYMTATSAFKDKYFAIPGDFLAATANSFGWGTIGGNANGMIEASATAASNEASAFWVHLSNAGLIEGNFTNVSNAVAWTIGTHNPKSKLNTAGWNILWQGSILPANTDLFASNYNNSYFFGTNTGGATPTLNLPGGVMKAEEAWNIDTKMDDGRPDQGSVMSLKKDHAAGNNCSIAGTPISYNLSNASTTACSLVFKSGY